MKKEILDKLDIIESQPERRLTKQQQELLANTVDDLDLLSDDEESEEEIVEEEIVEEEELEREIVEEESDYETTDDEEEDDYKNELEEIEMRMAIVDELNLEEHKNNIDQKYQNKIKQGDVVHIEWVDNVMEDLDEFVKEEYEEDISIPMTPKPVIVEEPIKEATPELVIDTTQAPLPECLSMSPMTPKPEIIEEVELETVVEEIDYSKMKVKELKALCKEMKIKGYSKKKKAELITMIKNNQ